MTIWMLDTSSVADKMSDNLDANRDVRSSTIYRAIFRCVLSLIDTDPSSLAESGARTAPAEKGIPPPPPPARAHPHSEAPPGVIANGYMAALGEAEGGEGVERLPEKGKLASKGGRAAPGAARASCIASVVGEADEGHEALAVDAGDGEWRWYFQRDSMIRVRVRVFVLFSGRKVLLCLLTLLRADMLLLLVSLLLVLLLLVVVLLLLLLLLLLLFCSCCC